jgi:hypothetical protein
MANPPAAKPLEEAKSLAVRCHQLPESSNGKEGARSKSRAYSRRYGTTGGTPPRRPGPQAARSDLGRSVRREDRARGRHTWLSTSRTGPERPTILEEALATADDERVDPSTRPCSISRVCARAEACFRGAGAADQPARRAPGLLRGEDASSRAHPAGDRRKPPAAPAHPRKTTQEKSCSRRESPASQPWGLQALAAASPDRPSHNRVTFLASQSVNRSISSDSGSSGTY